MVSYFIGNDPAQWRPAVPVWGGVRYVDLYPGVDLEVTGEAGGWTWRLVVRPEGERANGRSPLQDVRLQVEGADEVRLDEGRLRLATAVGEYTLPLPTAVGVAGLPGEGPRVERAAAQRFDIRSPFTPAPPHPRTSQDRPGSQIPNPQSEIGNSDDLRYATFLGGSGSDKGRSVAVDTSGNIYVSGETYSINFPAINPIQATNAGSRDAFVTKLDAAGSIVYSTYLGGSDQEDGLGITVDTLGNAYVTGVTYSSNYPTMNPVQAIYGGSRDAFVTKLNATGSALIYSTYLGGTSFDIGWGIAVDPNGNTYVTGDTNSSNFPTVNPIQATKGGGWDAFVTKLDATGSTLVYSTYLGGNGDENLDHDADIAVDIDGNAYVTGYTTSTNFPTVNPIQATNGGGRDAFVTKLNSVGSAIVYSTYLGGNGNDVGKDIAIDISDNIYVAGVTSSTNFPIANPVQATNGGSGDTFVTKLNAAGSAFVYSTYLGGSNSDAGWSIAVDADGNAYVAGRTWSSDFPATPGVYDTSYNGGDDAFVAKLNADGSALLYATFLGGSNEDWGHGIAVDGAGNAYLTGYTRSSDFPATPGAYDTSYNGGGDAFVAKLAVGGGAAPTPSLTVAPTSVPADGTSTATVTLTNALAGHRVRLISSRGSVDTFAPATGTTDASGQFVATVHSSTPGTAVITAEDLTTGQAIPASVSITFTPVGGEPPPPPPNEGAIAITGVENHLPLNGVYPLLADPLTGQLFSMLDADAFENAIHVHVDWKGTVPGGARLILNGQSRDVAAMPDGSIQLSLNMAQDLSRGTNTLQIIAYNANGDVSEPRVWAPLSWTASDWLASFLNVLIDEEIRLGYVDGTPTEIEVWLYIPPKQLLSKSRIPGAGEIGLSGVQAYGKMELPFSPAEEARLRAGARYLNERERRRAAGRERLGLSIFGTKLSVGAYGLGTGRFQPDGSFHFNAVGGGAEVEIAREWRKSAWVIVTTMLGAPPQVSDFLDTLPYVGEFMQRIAYGYLRAEGRLEGQFEYQIDPTRHFRTLTLILEPGLEVGGQFDARAIRIRVYAGGSLEATLLCYSNVDEDTLSGTNLFCRGVLNGRAGLFAKAFWFSRDFSWEWRHVLWGEEGVQLTSVGTPETTSTPWRLLGHGYRKPYAVFRKPLPGRLTPFSPQALGITPEGLAVTTASGVLVSNVYTYTEPSLALNPANDNALLLWVHDDVNKPLGQNFDLAYSRWDGSAWSAPARVTDDTYLDGAPQVAWDGTGKGLAVWERLNDPALPITATLDTTTTQKIEIAWAQYDPGTDSWSAPAWLTTNSALDHKPVLARNAAGGLMAAWRQNGAGLLSGDAANPDRVMFATWDGSSWSTLAVAVDNIPGLVDLAAGYGDGAATLAYTRFLTPTGGITPTLQLFTATWDGSAWSAPQQLTDDDLGHTNPQVVYNTLNQPLLVWQAGDTLRLRNLTTGAEADLTLDPDLMVDEFRLLHDSADNLAAVFTGQKAGQRDLFVAFYDAAHNAWGRPYRLTDDVHSEGYPAPALDSAGRLLMAYAQTQITSEERTTTDPDTGEVITYTLPVEGQTDLYTLSHQFVQDLAMGALAVSDTHPQPGASVTVSATVTNTGALALDGVQVAFYEGDPDAGGILLGTVTLPGTLAAGYTATLTTTYTIPTTGGQQQVVALADPQDQIVEADETNNRATLFAFGPDLELAGARVEYWSGSQVGLTALIRNIGTTASPTTTIAYHWEAITGTVAVTDTVPPLAAGQAITLTTPWDYGALAQGSYPLAAVVNAGEMDFAETFMANNEALLTLEVLPDLAVSPLYLWTRALPDARVIITATVYNFGSVAAPPAEAAFYVNQALTDTARIGVVPVPALEPGGQAVITATWDSPEWGEHAFYVAVDPGRALTETTWTNNLAGVSGASACTLLEGDVNCSCAVDITDLQTVAALWRQTAEPPYDLDGDQRVTVADIMRVAAAWGSTCPGG